jgi:DNA protecting protein DprA
VTTEREKLIRLLSHCEPTPWLIQNILEFGVNHAIARVRKTPQLITYAKPSLAKNPHQPVSVITYFDDCWPKQLFDLDTEMPLVLWVNGNVQASTAIASTIAIVGATQPSLSSVRTAGRIIRLVTAETAAIFSDGSFGISSLGHRMAISINRPNFAVLPAGVNQRYPKRNHMLLSDIAKTGALISEYPPHVAVSRGRLLRRNRIIAALSDLTVVIAAPPRSGAANIAYWAEQLGREIVELR